LFAVSGTATGEVLFSDNFNNAGTPADPDYGLNANLSGRLGGVSVIFVGRDYTGVELQKDSQQADSLRYSPRR